MPLSLIEVTLPRLEENLALDEALLSLVEQESSEGILRLWEWPDYAVVLGSSSRLEQEVHLSNCAADGVQVVRRCSGGGVVLVGPGSLLYSLILPANPAQHMYDIKSATRTIMERFRDHLLPFVPGIQVQGTSDLTLLGRKVSGNAQRWLKRTFLHHGTLLYDFDNRQMERYLNRPFRQPDYREERSHGEFVTNLPLTGDALRRITATAWNAEHAEIDFPLERVEQLVRDKYTQRDWLTKL